MGEIPERSLFKQPGLQKALDPYFQITKVKIIIIILKELNYNSSRQ